MGDTAIQVDLQNCTGCNACVRACPVDQANYVTVQADGRRVTSIHDNRCIKCGECVKSCPHHCRTFADDTEEFWKDLKSNVLIRIIVAPAIRTAFGDKLQAVLEWLRGQGNDLGQIITFLLRAVLCRG